MTPPLMPVLQGISSALTAPTGDPNAGQPAGPPRDRAYWTRVIHNVAQVRPDDPRYVASRQVRDQALQGLQDLADTAGQKDIKDISPGKLGTAAVSFGHGASLGLAGDPTYLQLAKEANPKTAFVSDLAGTAALGGVASPLVAGVGPVAGGVVLGGGLGAARGAIEPIPGMSRGESAALMGTGGAITGAVLGKFASKLVPVVRTIYGNVARALGTSAAPEDIAAIAESAVRARLSKMGVKPEIIEQAVANWKANGTLSVRAAPPEPVAVRPGETVTPTVSQKPILPELRANADPMETTPAYIRGGNPRGLPDLGKGQTLPYYPRGGQVEQGMAPLPAQGPSGTPPNQSTVLVDYLKQATSPQDAIARLGTLHNLGIPVPQDPSQILQLLFGAH